MKHHRHALLALALASCDAPVEAPFSLTPTVRDSAGVRIVEYPTPDRWELDLPVREILRIGSAFGDRPELQFSYLAAGRILDDGTIVVADRVSREVRRFAPGGSFLGSHGREGEGPGEYEYIRGMGSCAPSGFTVFDLHWGMSFYDASGAFLEERAPRLEGGATPYELACHASGLVAVTNWDMQTVGTQGFHVASARLRLFDADGAEVADLGERVGSERFGHSGGSGPHPLGRQTRVGFSGDDLIVSDGGFFGFERWSLEGKLEEMVRVAASPPDPDSLMAEFLASELAGVEVERSRRAIRERAEAMTEQRPASSAHLADMHVAAAWILLQEMSFESRGRWFAFTADGTPVGFLPLPPGARLLDMRGNRVLVEERDDLDVPTAVLYELDLPELETAR